MAGPSRPTPPSALDGYRRLARTRGAASTTPVAVDPERRRARAGRIAGALRLVVFVGVLAIIVGTSVGLASADTRGKDRTADKVVSNEAPTPALQGPILDVASTNPVARDTADVVKHPAKATPKVDAAPKVTAAQAVAPTTAAAVRPRGSLPYTGAPEIDRLLLGGAMLVLLGMLVQIAGQPLPATARARA
jgi:hypothetical protein